MFEHAEILLEVGFFFFFKDQELNTRTLQQDNICAPNTLCEDPQI